MKHSLSKLTIVVTLLTLILWGCSKKDYAPQTDYNNAAVKQFLTVPNNAAPALKNLIGDLNKGEDQLHFLSSFIKKNGMPVWDKTLSNLDITTNSGISNQITTFSTEATISNGFFFIPLIDTVTKELIAYITCNKTESNSYSYQVFNKKDILNYTLKSKKEIDNGFVLMGIMTAIEITFNKSKPVSYPSPYNFKYGNAQIIFGSPVFKGGNGTNSHQLLPKNATNNITVLGDDCPDILLQTIQTSGGFLYVISDCNGNIRFVNDLPSGLSDGGGTPPNTNNPPPNTPPSTTPPPAYTPPPPGYTPPPTPPSSGNPDPGNGAGTNPIIPPYVPPGGPWHPFWNMDDPNAPTENSVFFEAADQAKVVDINKMMKCFENIPNAGATYQVKLCVDVPVNDNPSTLWTGLKKAGHAFITMTKTNGSESVT